MTDLERDLPARLSVLADELTGPAPAVSAPAAIARYRARRRTHVLLGAVAAAVVAIAVGVPATIGSLASAPERNPAAPSVSATTTATPTVNGANPEAIAEAEDRAAQASAAAAAAQPELDAVAAALPADLTLTSPTVFDQWLPQGKPFPGPSLEEEISTCPVLSDRLGAALGQQMSYWTGTLPGPGGCTWVPVPLKYGPDPYDYAYVLNVDFVGDGTTVEALAENGFSDRSPDGLIVPCPRLLLGDALLVRCTGQLAATGSTWTLAVPDARGAGIWTLTADARLDAAHTSAEAFVALVEGVVANYG